MPNYQQKEPGSFQIWMPLIMAAMLVGGMLIGVKVQSGLPNAILQDEVIEQPRYALMHGRMEELLRYIDAKYVEEVDRSVLEDEAIRQLLEELDPHSTYIPRRELQRINEHLNGSFQGVGIEFIMVRDTVVVVMPLPDGPADKAGIQPGDKIVSINDTTPSMPNLETDEFLHLLRGNIGSEVELGVLREGEDKIRYFTVTRDEIPIRSLEVAMMLDNKVGYLKLNRFSGKTYQECMEALEQLINEGMEHLVLDLRGNPGGYLQEATKLLNQFFPEKGKLLVYTEGENVRRSDYKTTGKVFYQIEEIAVLIDEESASASEIVAGAIQDWDRGVVIGRCSFGKGLVQEQYKLSDGSALRLTVARYYTPSGRSIQKPYAEISAKQHAFHQQVPLQEKTSDVTLESSTLIDTMEYYTVSGRKVYGGGGISPDIYVPSDSFLYSSDYQQVFRLIPIFFYQRANALTHQAGEKYATEEEFADHFEITAATWEEFVDFTYREMSSESDTTTFDWKESWNAPVKKELKARMAKHLYGNKGYYRVSLAGDLAIEKARNALHSSNPLTYK